MAIDLLKYTELIPCLDWEGSIRYYEKDSGRIPNFKTKEWKIQSSEVYKDNRVEELPSIWMDKETFEVKR